MPPLQSGICESCQAEDVALRTNPFTKKEECEECRDAEIISITVIKKQHKLKDTDLEGLTMKTEPLPAIYGKGDRKWYLVKEVEKRVVEVKEEREKDKKDKDDAKAAAKKEKDDAKEEAKKAKESAKKEKRAAAAKEVKRKRDSDTEQDEKGDDNGDEEPEPSVKRGRGRPAEDKNAPVKAKAAATMKAKEKAAPKEKKKSTPSATKEFPAKEKKIAPVTNADGTVKRGRGRAPKVKG
ncbi:unnamed protein product [Diplocarpon coronariae]|uniref:Uncharacterized protein n=1 Tax=Diplocarpon coronariae TaxID=2795749 RepID=A0A218YWN4_9HELO|nr:hypothetical protein JHW43_003597 [Diplocarpon mali]OWO99363.1 hypothetical protein B2J93_8760 [Marssonina coronariae]